jgi:hypothetical protein
MFNVIKSVSILTMTILSLISIAHTTQNNANFIHEGVRPVVQYTVANIERPLILESVGNQF